jgi:hypothetical protein
MKQLSIIWLSSLALVFTSCLKDKNIDDQKYGTKGLGDSRLVLFPSARTTTTLVSSAKDTTFRLVTVRLAEANPAAEDIQVTLVPNNALVTGGGYSVAPASAYTLSGLTVTIPKGEREGYVNITTKTSNLAASTYGFGFTISAISNPAYTISATGKDFLAVLPVKNKYDGKYTMTGTIVDVAAATITAKPNAQVQLWTVDGSTVVMYNSGAAFSSQVTLFPIYSGGSESAYGGFMPVFFFDANDNIIKVENNFGQPNPANTRSAVIDPTGINKYDPATKTIKVKFFMDQPSLVPSGHRASFDMTLVYTGPR